MIIKEDIGNQKVYEGAVGDKAKNKVAAKEGESDKTAPRLAM